MTREGGLLVVDAWLRRSVEEGPGGSAERRGVGRHSVVGTRRGVEETGVEEVAASGQEAEKRRIDDGLAVEADLGLVLRLQITGPFVLLWNLFFFLNSDLVCLKTEEKA